MKTTLFLKPFLAIPLSTLCAATALAMPAKRTVYHEPDGNGGLVAVRLVGDENFHYYVNDADGTLLTRQGETFVKADISADGAIIPSDRPVRATERKRLLDQRRRDAPNKVAGLVAGTTFPARGEQKAVVILVQYQDAKFNLDDPAGYFTRMLNEEGFSDYWATGSARDWFIHSSNGLFRPTFDVYGPVTLQKNREFYGGNDAFDQDNAPHKMAIEGCRQLNQEVDFSLYDRDGDGVIDNVFVVYAGRGEASGGPAESVWPHAWKITSAEPGASYTFDGVKLDRYACVNEWELSDQGRGYRPVGIGSFIHEFSHVMGLPDLYSTKYAEGTFTAGAWSAMDYGPYNNDGCTPPQYSAWERSALGYSEPSPLPEKGNIAIKPLDAGNAYIIPTENDNEFFILENRQQSGWDSHIPGHGMLVWHIDYDAEIWRTNTLNNDPAHNHVDIIEADGTRDEKSRDGDCFPGAAAVTSLSASTTPALKSWAGISTSRELTEITERTDGTIIMRLNGGAPDIAAPAGLRATDILAGGFTARWEDVPGAVGYTVRVYSDGVSIDPRHTDGATSLGIKGLTPATDYSFIVTADDGFFGSGLFGRFDGVLAMYHDQGLAPFKALAMDEGVNFTAGLPWVRTSPDHGTGYDIAGEGKASEASMRSALYMAIDVLRNRRNHAEATADPLKRQAQEKPSRGGSDGDRKQRPDRKAKPKEATEAAGQKPEPKPEAAAKTSEVPAVPATAAPAASDNDGAAAGQITQE